LEEKDEWFLVYFAKEHVLGPLGELNMLQVAALGWNVCFEVFGQVFMAHIVSNSSIALPLSVGVKLISSGIGGFLLLGESPQQGYSWPGPLGISLFTSSVFVFSGWKVHALMNDSNEEEEQMKRWGM